MISSLRAQQLDDLRALRLELHSHHASLPTPPGFRFRDPDAAWQTWKDATTRVLCSGRGNVIVHRDRAGAPPTGFAVAMLVEDRERPIVEPTGPIDELETLVVSAAQRGNGIGQELYEAATRWLHHRGCVVMAIAARATNEPALRLYRRLGAIDTFVTQYEALPHRPAGAADQPSP